MCSRCGCAKDGLAVDKRTSRNPGRPRKESHRMASGVSRISAKLAKEPKRTRGNGRETRTQFCDDRTENEESMNLISLSSPKATVRDIERAF